ncbi:DUF6397 family protein [Streptomyces sp. NPDC089919]|uniref:DUF6397 family protein n=1 Tax=Streptomyces sp. NPDC089919 TaxID=3155188 RepID=UPI003429A89A
MDARKALDAGRAAEELGLRRSEFEIAVELGAVCADAGPERWSRAEIDRVRSRPEYPQELYDQVRTVQTAAGAGLLGIGSEQLRGLARCGYVTPVAYRVNRYHAVVWLYLAQELRAFAAREPELIRGFPAPGQRTALAAGEDQRPRTWRARRTGRLLRRTADPWERAAAVAAVLEPPELSLAVPDEGERILLCGLAPPPPYGHPVRPGARAVGDRLLKARGPGEVAWYRAGLELALAEARSAAGPLPPPPAGPGGRRSVEEHRGERPDIEPGAALPGEAAVLLK